MSALLRLMLRFESNNFISLVALTYFLCVTQSSSLFWALIAISFLVGILLIIPISGTDMPVVISILNFTQGGQRQV